MHGICGLVLVLAQNNQGKPGQIGKTGGPSVLLWKNQPGLFRESRGRPGRPVALQFCPGRISPDYSGKAGADRWSD